MDQRAILVVEDTAPIAEIIETVLNDIPAYQATAVTNGAAALVQRGVNRPAVRRRGACPDRST